jgi:hypothetical protein
MNDKIVMNAKFSRMKQEVVVAHFKVMYEHYSVTDATKI